MPFSLHFELPIKCSKYRNINKTKFAASSHLVAGSCFVFNSGRNKTSALASALSSWPAAGKAAKIRAAGIVGSVRAYRVWKNYLSPSMSRSILPVKEDRNALRQLMKKGEATEKTTSTKNKIKSESLDTSGGGSSGIDDIDKHENTEAVAEPVKDTPNEDILQSNRYFVKAPPKIIPIDVDAEKLVEFQKIDE